MALAGIRVLLFPGGEPLPYDALAVGSEEALPAVLATFRPDVIVTFSCRPKALMDAPFEVRRRWIDVDPAASVDELCRAIEYCYRANLGVHPGEKDHPLTSFFSVLHEGTEAVAGTFEALKALESPDWEWVVLHQGPEGSCWLRLREIAFADIRVRAFHAPAIEAAGSAWRAASDLARGRILVPLAAGHRPLPPTIEELRTAFADPSVEAVAAGALRAFRADAFHRAGGYNPRLRSGHETDLEARVPSRRLERSLLSGRHALRDLSVIVLDAAGLPETVRCLRSIRRFAPGAQVVLVADGAAPAPGAAELADRVAQLETNVGTGAGRNRGAELADRPVLCFLENGAEFVDDTPVRLLSSLDGGPAIVAPHSNRASAEVPGNDRRATSVGSACLMLPADVFRRVGGFDPRCRLRNREDDDFCHRAARLGVACRVVEGTFVRHDGHETAGAPAAGEGDCFAKKQIPIRVLAIARDEGNCIREYFEQFRPATSEFFLLDTGSSDGTVAAARSCGAVVETAEFQDFAHARNLALDRFGGDAGWIVMMDPDERLDAGTIASLREIVFRAEQEGGPDVFLAPLHARYADGSERAFVPKPFLFRNRPELRWVGRVHEKLIGSHRQALVRNARITHLIPLHDPARRNRSSELYDRLEQTEPYFQDPEYRERLRREWPILDYDRTDDPRLRKVSAGPLVSVVIPTYRRVPLLTRAVASALAQDYFPLEVVVVGDACPDLAAFAVPSPLVRVRNLPRNHGPCGGVPRNYGVLLSAGELVAYLDDDNEWESDHVSSLVSALRAKEAGFAFSSMSVDGRDLGFREPKLGGIDTSCLLHRRDLLARYGGWRSTEEAGYANDWDLVKRWLDGGERWAATGRATLRYNAGTSGQADWLKSRAAPDPSSPP